jgi:hypothetical protein
MTNRLDQLLLERAMIAMLAVPQPRTIAFGKNVALEVRELYNGVARANLVRSPSVSIIACCREVAIELIQQD